MAKNQEVLSKMQEKLDYATSLRGNLVKQLKVIKSHVNKQLDEENEVYQNVNVSQEFPHSNEITSNNGEFSESTDDRTYTTDEELNIHGNVKRRRRFRSPQASISLENSYSDLSDNFRSISSAKEDECGPSGEGVPNKSEKIKNNKIVEGVNNTAVNVSWKKKRQKKKENLKNKPIFHKSKLSENNGGEQLNTDTLKRKDAGDGAEENVEHGTLETKTSNIEKCTKKINKYFTKNKQSNKTDPKTAKLSIESKYKPIPDQLKELKSPNKSKDNSLNNVKTDQENNQTLNKNTTKKVLHKLQFQSEDNSHKQQTYARPNTMNIHIDEIKQSNSLFKKSETNKKITKDNTHILNAENKTVKNISLKNLKVTQSRGKQDTLSNKRIQPEIVNKIPEKSNKNKDNLQKNVQIIKLPSQELVSGIISSNIIENMKNTLRKNVDKSTSNINEVKNNDAKGNLNKVAEQIFSKKGVQKPQSLINSRQTTLNKELLKSADLPDSQLNKFYESEIIADKKEEKVRSRLLTSGGVSVCQTPKNFNNVLQRSESIQYMKKLSTAMKKSETENKHVLTNLVTNDKLKLIQDYNSDDKKNQLMAVDTLLPKDVSVAQNWDFKTIPFIVGKSTSRSYHIGLNIQQTFAIIKRSPSFPTLKSGLEPFENEYDRSSLFSGYESTRTICKNRSCPAYVLKENPVENDDYDSNDPWCVPQKDEVSQKKSRCTCLPKNVVNYNEFLKQLLKMDNFCGLTQVELNGLNANPNFNREKNDQKNDKEEKRLIVRHNNAFYFTRLLRNIQRIQEKYVLPKTKMSFNANKYITH